jgi:hypothetical protein
MSEQTPEVVAAPVTTDASQAKDAVPVETTTETTETTKHTFQVED